MPFPADGTQPESFGPHGWIVAGVVAVLGAIGTFWTQIRGGRREDSTTALTHANRIIRSHESYATRRDKRIVELEDEIKKLWTALGDTTSREQLCVMRMEWLRGILRENDIDIPDWPFSMDGGSGGPAEDGGNE